MVEELIFFLEWLALAVLLGYLWYKRWQREAARGCLHYEKSNWTGKGLDASQLKPKLEAVRRNYVAALRPATSVGSHRNLIIMARRAILELDFFRREPAPDGEEQGSSSVPVN